MTQFLAPIDSRTRALDADGLDVPATCTPRPTRATHALRRAGRWYDIDHQGQDRLDRFTLSFGDYEWASGSRSTGQTVYVVVAPTARASGRSPAARRPGIRADHGPLKKAGYKTVRRADDHSTPSARRLLQHVMPPPSGSTRTWSLPCPSGRPTRYVSVSRSAPRRSSPDRRLRAPGFSTALPAGLDPSAPVATVRRVLVARMHFDRIGSRQFRQGLGAWIATHPADRDLRRPDYRSAGAGGGRGGGLPRGARPHRLRGRDAVGAAGRSERSPPRSRSRPAAHRTGSWPRGIPLEAARHAVHHARAPVLHWTRAVAQLSPRSRAARDSPRTSASQRARLLTRSGTTYSTRRWHRPHDLDMDEVLPAHQWRIPGLPGRGDAVVAHHERRLAELLAAIRQRPGSTPWQLAGYLTWSRPWDQYSGQMRIFAVTETAAHAHLQRAARAPAASRVPGQGRRR